MLGNARTYDSANRLTGDADYAYTYDANGNLIEKRHRTSGARSVYSWNARNQLLSVQRFADEVSTQPTEMLTYTYDALDRRVTRNANGAIERYVYRSLDRIETIDSAGNVVDRVTFAPGIDQPLAINGASGSRYLHANHLGSIIGLSGSTSTLGHYEYEPYGRLLGTASVPENPFRYTGREYEAEDLYYYRARYYDPVAGRFLSEDPIGLLAGTNLYAYVGGNPVSFIDPYGLWAWGDPVPQPIVDYTAGFGDAASLGLSSLVRDAMGTNDAVDKCSTSYSAGSWTTAAFGAGRLAYAGAARGYSMFASSGAAASAFRSQLRGVFGGGPSLRPPDLTRYATDDALRAAAGRTNPYANTYGAGAAAAGAYVGSGCGCDQ